MPRQMVGDLAVQNLAPQTINVGQRLVKNMRICGSGVYSYHKNEPSVAAFGLVVTGDTPEMVNIYRPPAVLEANKDKFARVPIITGRHQTVTPENAKQLTVGLVGDTVLSEIDPKDGELYLYTTGTIVAGDGIEAYERSGELSVGYFPTAHWEKGVHKGIEYHAVLDGFDDVNHLLICKEARGGHKCAVLDSANDPFTDWANSLLEANRMNIFQKILSPKSPAPKKVAGDAKPEVVSALLCSIAAGADPVTQVKAIREITDKLPVGDSHTTFDGYLKELEGAKPDTDKKVLGDAITTVVKFYTEKLVGDAEEEKDEEKEAGDSGECPKCHKDPCVCKDAGDADPEKKDSAGDSLVKFTEALNARLDALEKKIDETKEVVGDEKKEEIKENAAALASLTSLLGAGDSKDKKSVSSAEFLASIIGGK